LTDDRVLHDRIAEMVNHCCDGKCATEPFVLTRLEHDAATSVGLLASPLSACGTSLLETPKLLLDGQHTVGIRVTAPDSTIVSTDAATIQMR
jgi:hypothetical protein